MVLLNTKNMETDYMGFEPTSTEISEELAKLSDKVIINNLVEQIDKVFENKISEETDILSIFDERYKNILILYADNSNVLEACKMIRYDLYIKIASKIIEQFKINTNILDEVNRVGFYDYIREMYNFFILRYRNNLRHYFFNLYTNHLRDYKNEITAEDKENNKFKRYNKILKDENKAYLLIHLEEIIAEEVTLEVDPLDIISDIISVDEYELTNTYMKKMLIDNEFDTYIDREFREAFFKFFDDSDNTYDMSIYLTIKFLEEWGITNDEKK